MLDPMIHDEFHRKFREPFQEQDDHALLAEQVRLIERLHPPAPLTFRSNHASNALALAGELPRDREKLLAQLGQAQTGRVALRPEWLRSY